jgi:hypothetical protein
MIAGDASKLLASVGIKPGQQQGPPPGAPKSFGGDANPNAMKTMIADGAAFGGAAAGPGAAAGGGAPPMSQPGAPQPGAPQPGAPQKTMMLNDTEGILSLAGKSAPAVEMPDPADQTGLTRAPGVTTTFWVVCLLTGLTIGVLAYLAVLKLGG